MLNKIRSLIPQSIKNKGHYLKAQFFHYYYGRPSQKIDIIGVTGTDGKTTTSTIIYEILKHAGLPTGLITTISAKIGEKEYPTGFHVTSPSPAALQKFLKEMVHEGMKYVVLETTSHALDQYRVGGLQYHSATFTNVSHEHLDYHGTYDEYLKTKAKLIDLVDQKSGFTVINKDDKSYDFLNKKSQENNISTFTYGFTDQSDLYATSYQSETGLTRFTVNSENGSFDVEMHLPGEYNVYNALGAIQVALKLGVDPLTITEAIKNIRSLEGRWEVIQENPFKVVVDFAHTPNALARMLEYAKKDNPNGMISVVFGSAGKRDLEKRPIMGQAAGEYADRVYLTSEDPRGETVENINRQIGIGLNGQGKQEGVDYFSIPDRREAITKAISDAKEGDTVIISGKGHEKSMNLDGINELPWSDQEVVKEILTTQKG